MDGGWQVLEKRVQSLLAKEKRRRKKRDLFTIWDILGPHVIDTNPISPGAQFFV